MYEYLDINNIYIRFTLCLLTFNVPLQIGKCTPGVHLPQVRNLCSRAGFFKESVRYPVWTCKDPIYLILGTRFSLILGTRYSILGTRIVSLKRLKNPAQEQ